MELQSKTVSTINKILQNEYVEEPEEQHQQMWHHSGMDFNQYSHNAMRHMSDESMYNHQYAYYGHYGHNDYLHDNTMYVKPNPNPFVADLEKFYQNLNEKRELVKMPRQKVVECINKIVDEIEIIEYIEIYGSYKTDLDLPSSDIDFLISSQLSEGSE